MFTGIIQTRGKVVSTQPNAFGVRLKIHPHHKSYNPAHGDSIAVNGVCLTHAPIPEDPQGLLCFDVIRETLDRTTLGRLQVANEVNLESSLRPDTPIAGHFVQGHVDAIGQITNIHNTKDEWRVTVRVEPTVIPFLVPKGSIAVDGISLTLATVNVSENCFTVALIPTTLQLTTFASRKVGDPVNLETDMIVRSVVHVLGLQGLTKSASTLTTAKLGKAGFTEFEST